MTIADKAATEVIKHAAMHIAASMIHGDYPERDRAYSTARDIQDEFGDFIQLVKHSITMLGSDPDEVWIIPAEILDEAAINEPEPQINVRSLRYHVARHIAGAYVSGNNDQFERAKELERNFAQSGLRLASDVNDMVLDAMRTHPRDRGDGGRADNCPF